MSAGKVSAADHRERQISARLKQTNLFPQSVELRAMLLEAASSEPDHIASHALTAATVGIMRGVLE